MSVMPATVSKNQSDRERQRATESDRERQRVLWHFFAPIPEEDFAVLPIEPISLIDAKTGGRPCGTVCSVSATQIWHATHPCLRV